MGLLDERGATRVPRHLLDRVERRRPQHGCDTAPVLARPERLRGDHPLASFSAIGPLATDLIDGQHGGAVHAPLRALGEMDGAIVMVGVGLTRMTLLHLAEQEAGRTQFQRWALNAAATR